jgi:hypothetical protein
VPSAFANSPSRVDHHHQQENGLDWPSCASTALVEESSSPLSLPVVASGPSDGSQNDEGHLRTDPSQAASLAINQGLQAGPQANRPAMLDKLAEALGP